MESIENLERERSERSRTQLSIKEKGVESRKSHQITCLDLEEMFGENYIRRLTTFYEEEVDEILSVCKEILKPTGPGRHYCDMKCRVIIYLTWLTSG